MLRNTSCLSSVMQHVPKPDNKHNVPVYIHDLFSLHFSLYFEFTLTF